MEEARLKGEIRKPAGGRAAGRLRRKGQIPGIVYGHGETPVAVALDGEQLTHHVHQGAHLVQLDLDGQTSQLLVKDVQYNYLGDTIVHVDLARVNLDEKVTVTVPLRFRHEPIGVKEEEGQLLTPLTQIEVECLVISIPSEIRVDVRDLHVGDSITVAQLTLPEGVTSTENPEQVVATVAMAREEEVAAVEEGQAEPEVIGRVKEEGEEGEEGAAPEAKPKAEPKTKKE